MKYTKQTSLSLLKAITCAIITVGVMATAHAQSTKVDPTGTWTWSTAGRNGGTPRTNTLVLKYSGTSLTGSVTAPARGGNAPTPTDIGDGKLTGDQISFTVTRERNGNSMVSTYAGTVTADTITGTISLPGQDGTPTSRKWEAKRAAAAAAN